MGQNKKMTKVFCIGNGESRKNFDLNLLRPYGKIYGCNALYRDFKPDVLVAVDGGVIHEIYDSGYCYNNETWFRDWHKLNEKEYNKIYYGDNIKDEEIQLVKKYFTNITENKKENSTDFSYHGHSLKIKLSVIKRYIDKPEKYEQMMKELNNSGLHISWLKEDKAHNLKEIFPDNKDFGWSAGPTSAYISIKQNNPKELYMLGHDLTSNDEKLNNVYKDTKWYRKSDSLKTTGSNWINQWLELFKSFPHIKFIKINNSFEEINNVNKKIKKWNDIPNLIYTTYEQSFSNW